MASDVAALVPDFIRFLFSTKPKFDCYFIVGNKSQGEPERIGAVKLMLMAHSEVFRLQLEDSDLAEKKDVKVKDVHPETFKGMLKYVYGHDRTSELCFDDADNMLYVAEKYMMQMLKDKLAVRLMQLLNPDNICSLLNNPACYKHLELDSAITEILRFETDHVLDSPQFVFMNAEGFLKILEQDGLAVSEIELWRAAIKWAKHRANSEDGQLQRKQLTSLTKHLRVCTLNGDETFEIMTSDIFTKEEIKALSLYQWKKVELEGLNDFSLETEPRKRLHLNSRKQLHRNVFEIMLQTQYTEMYSVREYNLTLLTKQCSIELLPLVCQSKSRENMAPENWTYKVECTATITKVANPENPNSSSTNEAPITVSFSENVKYGVEFEIPFAVDGRNVTLQPDTKYTIMMKLTGYHMSYSTKNNLNTGDDQLKLTIKGNPIGPWYYYYFPSDKLHYRVTAVE